MANVVNSTSVVYYKESTSRVNVVTSMRLWTEIGTLWIMPLLNAGT